MDLTSISVRLRPRSSWEGIDLGFMLARRWFFPLWILWLISALPVMLLLSLAPIPLWAKALLLWWFKPMYEPLLLYWLSRQLFNDRPDWREIRSRWRGVVLPHLIANLTWRRFNPERSFVMPVAVLERLKGKTRSKRISVLGRSGHAASWLGIFGLLFEVVLTVGFVSAIGILIPDELAKSESLSYLFSPEVVAHLFLISFFIAISLLAPFYVAGGFVIYITRRSELEAWDLELGLRRMLNRYQQSGSRTVLSFALLLCFSISLFPVASVDAAEPSREQVREMIDDVLAHEDFGHYEEHTSWRYIGKETDEEDGWLAKWLENIIKGFVRNIAWVSETLLWLLAGAVLAYLVYWFLQNQGLLNPKGRRDTRRSLHRPTHIAGLDLRPESLPRNPADEALQLIESGDYREAFALLYRAALSALVHQFEIEIPDGATEGECSHLARKQLDSQLHEFFSRLTSVWQMLAYGHRLPDKSQAIQICRQWQSNFGGDA